MIIVTVGSSVIPFDRLMRALAALPRDERLVVQTGASKVRPPGAECVDFMPFDELVDHVRAASAVITHAGVGSTMLALSSGKRPIVVPRRPELGEAIDDHQVQFGRRLESAGLVTLVEDAAALAATVAETADLPAVRLRADVPLAADVGRYLAGVIRPRTVDA
jgi:UDP-N-acetylglucosamine transferase subunit ALG13